jgi:predicted nucleic acid-binding protein
MNSVQLIADTNVVSYLFHRSTLGFGYAQLIGFHRVGVTGQCLAEIRAGAVIAEWGERKRQELARFLGQFVHVPDTAEMAEVCGALRGYRTRIGEPIDWPDAWAAACALWLEVPLVTHDRDLEGIPGLRILTLHKDWQIRDGTFDRFSSKPLWLVDSSSRRDALGHLASRFEIR